MTSPASTTEHCQASDCAGAQLEGGHCLEHLTPTELIAVTVRLQAGEPLDARNTTISAECLQELLQALRQDDRPVLPLADFRGATFSADADFSGAAFSVDADFNGATFVADAYFSRVTFSADDDFNGATFVADAYFNGATFSAVANFRGATFSADAYFNGATFSAVVNFRGATFSADAYFSRATFNADAYFNGATFSADASFASVFFGGDANFARVAFERARELSAFVVSARLVLDDCVFFERIRLEVAARVLSARATTFAAGVLLRVRWAEIALDDADFARPSTISGATTWRIDNDLQPACLLDDRHLQLDPCPRLMTIRGAQVAALSLSNVDLRACRFFGAHGLDRLTIESSCLWPRAPRTFLRVDRETIAEEHSWRGWDDLATRPPAWLKERDEGGRLKAVQVGALYRVLRKAREDGKDEAGSGDLYYGEMEMRRHAAPSNAWGRPGGGGTAVILRAYWLLSGYGLRPVRAFAALSILLLVGAAVLSWYGFHDSPGHARGYGRALLFATESAVSVLRPPQTSLSAGGEITQISLRLLGPLLLGLALLAIRARVKR